MLYIQNATVLTPTEQIDTGALLTDGTRIAAVGPVDEIPCPDDAQIIDAAGLFLAPGFIDLQINGAFGYDFTGDPTTIWPVAAKLPRYGVTAFLPTIISSPLETVAAARKVVTQAPVSGVTGAIPLGLHIEGPFLNPKRKGAHNPEYLLSPDLGAVANWSWPSAQGTPIRPTLKHKQASTQAFAMAHTCSTLCRLCTIANLDSSGHCSTIRD
jgi:N-acetylglucosamine-6-phosphate deacetylase